MTRRQINKAGLDLIKRWVVETSEHISMLAGQ